MEDIFPIITMFAVANSALINMLMASRLLYGMAKQAVLPPALGRVHAERRTPWVAIIFTTLLALGLIIGIGTVSEDAVLTLGGTTSLLLLAVFTIVNIAVSCCAATTTLARTRRRTTRPVRLLVASTSARRPSCR
jgi:amino acid transporter